MRETRTAQIVAALLIVASLTLVGVKWLVAGITPDRAVRPLWHVQVRLSFKSLSPHTSVRLFVPRGGVSQTLLHEHFDDDQLVRLARSSATTRNRSVRWRETAPGQSHVLGYSAWLDTVAGSASLPAPGNVLLDRLRQPTKMIQSDDPALRQQGRLLVGSSRGREAVKLLLRFVSESILEDGDQSSVSATRCLKTKRGSSRSRARLLCALLRSQNVPCQLVGGVRMDDDVRTHAFYWAEAWDGKQWLTLCPTDGVLEVKPRGYLPFFRGDYSLARFHDCDEADLLLTVERQLPPLPVQAEMARASASAFDRWSLNTLPADTQQMVGLLLLLPVGSLMVAAFRNLIGVTTIGIFMPILLALAFRETGLSWGLAYLAGIVMVGVIVRRLLNRLKLLMIPRLATVLTVVVAMMIGLIFLGSRFGIHSALSVGLFPLVIISTTVERFFVLQSEDGTAAALRESGNTAAVAACGFLLFQWRWLGKLLFVYPELLLVVVACLMLLGRYSGYRLMELRRFRSLTLDPEAEGAT